MGSIIVLLSILCHFNFCFSSTPSVIIVGAGASGIAAATKLLENSITNITILEAQNRIGGRILSVHFGDALVDLGAEHCSGEKGNVVYELTKDFGLLTPTLFSIGNDAYFSNGTKVNRKLIEEIENSVSITDEVENYSYNTTGKSMGDVFQERLNLTLSKMLENETEKTDILKDSFRFSEGLVIQEQGSFSWFDSSAESDYQTCEGTQFLNWDGRGYKTILEIMMKSLPDPNNKLPIDDKIFLRKRVTKINWNGQSVSVQTQDRSSYSADYVILTPSIGVLKKRKNTLFNPKLPLSKVQAIEAIGFAAVMKVFMYFPTKWWDNATMFSFFWKSQDLKTVDFQAGPSKNGISWVAQIRNVAQVPNNPKVLVGWIAGDLVPEVEKIPTEMLKEGFMYVLKKFLKNVYNVTEMTQILKTTWYSNNDVRGTYSYTKAGTYSQSVSYQRQIAEPLESTTGKPSLLFAGEATNPIHYGSVHGAIETGYREAERIIRLNSK